jgi:hypothetical protein
LREQKSSGILQKPEVSGEFWGKYRNSCPTGIPAKNSRDSKKTGIPATSPQPRSCEKFLRKTQKKGILRNRGRNVFPSKK